MKLKDLCKFLSIMNNEPKDGSLLKQRISLQSKYLMLLMYLVLLPAKPNLTRFFLQYFSENMFPADVCSAPDFLAFLLSINRSFFVEFFLCCWIPSFEVLSFPRFLWRLVLLFDWSSFAYCNTKKFEKLLSKHLKRISIIVPQNTFVVSEYNVF